MTSPPRRIVVSYAALFRGGGGAAPHCRPVRRRHLEAKRPEICYRAQGASRQDHQLVGVQERT